MAPGSSSRRNALPRSRLVPTPAPVRYIEEDLRTMTSSAWIRSSRLKPVVPNPQANEKCEDHFDTYGRRYLLQQYPVRIHILCGRISFHRHQHKRRNQAAEAPLPRVEFKLSFGKVLVAPVLWGVDTIWSRVKRNSQYQWEEVHNWASHLEHPQSIKFDADRASESPTSFDFFKKDVSLRLEQRGMKLDS